MRKFLTFLLIICLGTTIAYGATRQPTKTTKVHKKSTKQQVKSGKKDVIDVFVPSKDVAKIVEDKSCGSFNRPLRVAGMIGNAPFGWVEADKSTQKNMESFGLGRVVLGKIAKDLHIFYQSVGYRSFEETIQALKKGEIDLLLGTYHDEIASSVEMVYPAYFTNVFTAYFKKGKELPIESYRDLAGLKGVVRKEELIYHQIYRVLPPGVQIKEVLSAPKVFEMLMNEEVDYILASPYALESELRRHKLQNDIVSDGTVLGERTLFFAFSKNTPCHSLKKAFSEVIRHHNFSQETLDKDIRLLIDDWGERFRPDDVLIQTINNTRPEDMKKPDSEQSQDGKSN